MCAVMVFIEDSSGPLKRARRMLDHWLEAGVWKFI